MELTTKELRRIIREEINLISDDSLLNVRKVLRDIKVGLTLYARHLDIQLDDILNQVVDLGSLGTQDKKATYHALMRQIVDLKKIRVEAIDIFEEISETSYRNTDIYNLKSSQYKSLPMIRDISKAELILTDLNTLVARTTNAPESPAYELQQELGAAIDAYKEAQSTKANLSVNQ